MKEMKNKKLAGIALVLCLVFAGGALTALISSIGGSSGGRLMLPEVEHECVFSLSTGTVSAAEDPDGKGYEYFACAECGEMRKVAANHESGHYFRTVNGKQVCACGAQIGIYERNLGKSEFSSLNESISVTYLNDNSCLEDLDGDGEFDVWNLSAKNTQYLLKPDNNDGLYELLTGNDDYGNVIDSLKISFAFFYTGVFAPDVSVDNMTWIFINYQQPNFLFALCFEEQEGKILAYQKNDRGNSVLLEPDVRYQFDLNVEPTTQRLIMTVEGDGLPKKVLFDMIANYPPLSDLLQIGIGRKTYYCSDGSFALYLDDLEISYELYTYDESGMNMEHQCDHNFKIKGIVDQEHPASEAWKKYTCKKCDCWYYGH